MVKTFNELIEKHCHNGKSPSEIAKLLKGMVSRSGVYKAVKRLRDTGSCLPKVRKTPEIEAETVRATCRQVIPRLRRVVKEKGSYVE